MVWVLPFWEFKRFFSAFLFVSVEICCVREERRRMKKVFESFFPTFGGLYAYSLLFVGFFLLSLDFV